MLKSEFLTQGPKVIDFEKAFANYIGSKYAISVSNGTAALHISLLLSGAKENDEILTQPLTFVATCNAISYTNATSVFIDVDKETMGMSPKSLKVFLKEKPVNFHLVKKIE